jgi:tetratricopeptide (TPR) repeat protein
MECHAQLDAAGGAAVRRLILLLLFLSFQASAPSGAAGSTTDRISEVKRLYDAGRWSEVLQAVPEASEEAADLQLYRGLALAQLQRWDEAGKTFAAGLVRNPRDTRFLDELAGIAYREKHFSIAKGELFRALAIDPQDNYANNFLASIYFLEDNLEAALKYWNRTSRPKLSDLTIDPRPSLKPLLLDRAFAFSRGREWRGDQLLTTRARLEALDLYPRMRFELEALPDDSFDLRFRAPQRNGWGNTRLEGIVSLLRGLPYQSVYPEFYNIDRAGLNWRSQLRWDDEKRRVFTEIAAPLGENPAIRYRIFFEGRNENWDLTGTLHSSIPTAAQLNMEKAAAGAELQFIAAGRWQWTAGAGYSYRRFRKLPGAAAAPFFTDGSGIALWFGVQRSLVRVPERRFTLDSSATGEFGTFLENPLGRYGRITGTLSASWFPKANGGDYHTQAILRGGRTFGKVPFDELFILGFDRDSELWLRGHPGLRNGKKGNAPLGGNYVLANLEMDKILYQGAFFTLKAGPFLDSGNIYDPSRFFGSTRYLCDTGIQARIRILGSMEFVLGYGKDLRSGNNSFFTAVSR